MSDIIISQTPTSYDLVLLPTSDNTVALKIYPTSPTTHFDKVDETPGSPNYDTDYVYCDTVSPEVVDVYNITNHTTETGTINYVKVISYAASYPTMQSPTGAYRHKIICGAGTALSANYAPLTTAYQPYTTIWTTRPADGLAWTWTDIDALIAGLSISSPTTVQYAQQIFRPNAAGYHKQSDLGSGYDMVDEETADDDVTYNEFHTNAVGYKSDLFNIPDTSLTGTIDKMEIFCRARRVSYYQPTLYAALYINSLEYYFAIANLGSGGAETQYVDASHAWTTNPNTSVAWTWANINSLQIGYGWGPGGSSDRFMRVTQCYAVVTYHWTGSPQVRATQLYVVVNYSPSPSSVTLIAPEEVTLSNTRKSQRFIFPDGTYNIADYGRSLKKMSLKGTVTSGAIQKMRQVQAMYQNTAPVTLSGMSDVNQDLQWRLSAFDYKYDAGGDFYKYSIDFVSYDGVV